MQLHSSIDDLLGGLCGMVFSHGRFSSDTLCGTVFRPGCPVYQQGAGVDAQGHFANFRLHQLQVSQFAAEDVAVCRVVEGFIKGATRHAQRCRGHR